MEKIKCTQILTILFKNVLEFKKKKHLRPKSSRYVRTLGLSPKTTRSYKKKCIQDLFGVSEIHSFLKTTFPLTSKTHSDYFFPPLVLSPTLIISKDNLEVLVLASETTSSTLELEYYGRVPKILTKAVHWLQLYLKQLVKQLQLHLLETNLFSSFLRSSTTLLYTLFWYNAAPVE